MKIISRLAAVCLIVVLSAASLHAQKSEEKKDIRSFTEDMELAEGYFDVYYDQENDKFYLQIDNLNEEFLYVNSLAAGLGSNDIGLDRGQLGDERIVRFERHGQKVLMVEPNYSYRAVSDNQDEVRSVEEAFARSVLWGFKIAASSKNAVLIDVSDFLLRDAHGVKDRLASRKQGTYKLDKSRSAFYKPNTLNFPKNTEFEAIISFTGDAKGGYIRSVAPSADDISVRMHHSFVELPDDDYDPREFDPRSAFNHITFYDYATPIDQPLMKKYIARHRLKKKNQEAEISEPVEPIIYYLDRGAPEPVRSALLEGARWWNQAFEAAGFRNAFQVKMLPEDAHPLDIRYNLIQWVHRSTRGWSYGASVVDPRTGEIIKGHVSLGSLRVRQDFLIAQGVLNQYDESTEPMKEMALARIRQLSAHEVGHTIGLTHNFAASYSDRASVMDYPHPMFTLDDNGNISLEEAYDTNIGEWDKVAITYGYADGPSIDELRDGLEKAFADGYRFIADYDARAADGAHPVAHLWDNGKDAGTELKKILEVRRLALDNLSENALPTGMPYSSMEDILVPMYLIHRYQVDAASKVIGGLNYNYAVKGGNQLITEFIDPNQQRDALEALVACLDPETLILSEDLLEIIPPKAFGYRRTRENFPSKTGPVWDYYAAVEAAAQVPLQFLLMPERANRLVMFKDRSPKQPGLESTLDYLVRNTWNHGYTSEKSSGIQMIVEQQLVLYLMKLAQAPASRSEVAAISMQVIERLYKFAKDQKGGRGRQATHYAYLAQMIERWMDDPEEIELPGPVRVPDGSPIGSPGFYNCMGY